MYSQYFLIFVIGISISTVPINAITRGYDSEGKDHRYLVAVMKINQNSNVELICGGAIIHHKYVLTAAHCVKNQISKNLMIRSGYVEETDGVQSLVDVPTYHRVLKTYIPRVYSNLPCRRHQHDIAILKVRESFDLTYDKLYQKVNLPGYNNDYEHSVSVLAGYGLNLEELQNDQNSTEVKVQKQVKFEGKLRSMEVAVTSNEDCQKSSNVIVTEGNLCATVVNSLAHSCFKDDGGPLVHDGTVIGILNDIKCNPNSPEIFTRVSTYLPFIYNVLKHQPSADILVQ